MPVLFRSSSLSVRLYLCYRPIRRSIPWIGFFLCYPCLPFCVSIPVYNSVSSQKSPYLSLLLSIWGCLPPFLSSFSSYPYAAVLLPLPLEDSAVHSIWSTDLDVLNLLLTAVKRACEHPDSSATLHFRKVASHRHRCNPIVVTIRDFAAAAESFFGRRRPFPFRIRAFRAVF